MSKTFKNILALALCFVMLLGTVAIGDDGFAEVLEAISFRASADETTYSVGDIIEYGNYPQSQVTDEDTITALNAIDAEWVSYEYYVGNEEVDGSIHQSDFMRYKDVSYNGEKYRAVTFDSYRPQVTWSPDSTSSEFSAQYENGYTIGNIYWFKYEPIKWRVLDTETGLVISETAIDAQPFNNYEKLEGSDAYGDADCTYYASNYAESSIREWLNNDFYAAAFSENQKSNILSTTVESKSVNDSDYDAPSVTDKVYLLSYSESLNSDYGFNADKSADDEARQLKTSDYAECQGCDQYQDDDNYAGNCWYWWMRSPGYSSNVYCGTENGHISIGRDAYANYVGVVPVMNLQLLKSDTALAGDETTYTVTFTYRTEEKEKNVLGLYSWVTATQVYELSEGESIPGYTPPEHSLYDFNGWNAEVPETMPAENLEFTAQYLGKQFNLTWNIDGEDYLTEQVRYGTSVTAPETEEKDGYILKWDSKPSTMPGNDLTVYGSYVDAYTITYYDEGAEYAVQKYIASDKITAPDDPTKDGHTFGGWVYTDADGNDYTGTTMPAYNLTATALWDVYTLTYSYRKDYKVTFLVFQKPVWATGSKTYKLHEGDEIPEFIPPEHPCYDFTGWDKEVPATMSAEDLTLTAQYTPKNFTLTWSAEGKDYLTETVAYDSAITAPDYPEKDGYIFRWADVPETMPGEDTTVYGEYHEAKEITYLVDGEVYTTQSYVAGDEVTAPDIPTKSGYTFSYWTDLPETMPDCDVTISAVFVEHEPGDIIQFGNYPQSRVYDSSLIQNLLAESENSEWISYNYYVGEGYYNSSDDYSYKWGSMSASDCMEYVDVWFNGIKYRGVRINNYRPYQTNYRSDSAHSYQDDNGYYESQTYWFRFEPINWRILDPVTGMAVCETIIDSQPYNEYVCYKFPSYYYGDSEKTYYANNYENSTIREWLNNDFCNTAFTDAQKSVIYSPDTEFGSMGDKVFMLSTDDVSKTYWNYNFEDNLIASDTAYAWCQGMCHSDSGSMLSWRLVSEKGTGSLNSNSNYIVDKEGNYSTTAGASNTSIGIRPAIYLSSLESDTDGADINYTVYLSANGTIIDSFKCEAGKEVKVAQTVDDPHFLGWSGIPEYMPYSDITVEANFAPVATISIEDGQEEIEISNGEEKSLSVSVSPESEKNIEISYSSSDETVASVDESGVVKGLYCGTAMITVKTKYDDYSSINVVVNHDYKSEITNPDCESQGYTTHTCSICGYVYTDSYLPALGHSYSNEVIESTCTGTGFTKHVCSRCGKEYTDNEIAAKGHTYTNEIYEPTCTEEGYTIHTCTVCGYSYKSDVVNAKGHTYKTTTLLPTCTEDGYSEHKCVDCGDYYVDGQTPATGHKFTNYVYNNDATIEKDGTSTAKCENCSVTDTISAPGTKLKVVNPTASAVVYATGGNVDYRTNVTLKAKATGVPEGYYIAIYEGDKQMVKGDNETVTFVIGEMKDGKTYTVKIIDSAGNVQKDASGNKLQKEVNISVNSGFFKKLVAFFKGLFGSLPSKTIQP